MSVDDRGQQSREAIFVEYRTGREAPVLDRSRGRSGGSSPWAALGRRALAAFLLAMAAVAAVTIDASAQMPGSSSNSASANAGTVGIISGGADGTYIRIAADLANVLDSENLRVLPIIGRGSLQNLRDIMFLRGVDIGIVQMDARQGLDVGSLQDAAQQKLRYIARLYNEELHVLASNDIRDIRQLDGQKVNIDKPGSG